MVPDNNDCHSYYICVKACCGNFTLIKRTCVYPYTFDPINQVCSNEYPCHTPEPISKCSETRLFYSHPDDKRRYYVCRRKTTLLFLKKLLTCPDGLKFDNFTKICKCQDNETISNDCSTYFSKFYENDNCVEDHCTSVKSLNYQPFFKDTSCTVEGVFADALSCTKYHACYKDKCGKIVKSSLICPGNTLFDPKKRECSCKKHIKCLCTNKNDTFECTEEGAFVNPLCSTMFYQCMKKVKIDYVAKELICPESLFWDKKKNMCNLHETKNDDSSSSDSTESSESGKSKYDSEDCSSDPNVKDCGSSSDSKTESSDSKKSCKSDSNSDESKSKPDSKASDCSSSESASCKSDSKSEDSKSDESKTRTDSNDCSSDSNASDCKSNSDESKSKADSKHCDSESGDCSKSHESDDCKSSSDESKSESVSSSKGECKSDSKSEDCKSNKSKSKSDSKDCSSDSSATDSNSLPESKPHSDECKSESKSENCKSANSDESNSESSKTDSENCNSAPVIVNLGIVPNDCKDSNSEDCKSSSKQKSQSPDCSSNPNSNDCSDSKTESINDCKSEAKDCSSDINVNEIKPFSNPSSESKEDCKSDTNSEDCKSIEKLQDDKCKGIKKPFPVEGDCRSYHICVDNSFEVRRCPEGFAFCSKKRRCRKEELVKCLK